MKIYMSLLSNTSKNNVELTSMMIQISNQIDFMKSKYKIWKDISKIYDKLREGLPEGD